MTIQLITWFLAQTIVDGAFVNTIFCSSKKVEEGSMEEIIIVFLWHIRHHRLFTYQNGFDAIPC